MTGGDRRPWFQDAFGAHYPLLYQHRDEAEARRCWALLPQLAPLTDEAQAPVLDLGCGDGRHLQWLRADHLDTVGLDLSPHLLALAAGRQGAQASPLVQGDMRQLPFAADCFASVLSLFTAFGYFGPPEANAGPINEVARVLKPGGHWFLDYFDGDRVLAELGDGEVRQRERVLACLRIRESRRYLHQQHQVVKEVHLSAVPGSEAAAAEVGVGPEGLMYTEQVAVFTLAEFDAMTASRGLVRVAAAGDYDGTPLGHGPRWLLVFRKEHDLPS